MNKFKCYLNNYGLAIPKVYLENYLRGTYSKYLGSLTITTHQLVGPPKVAKLYDIREDPITGIKYVYVPRTELDKFSDNFEIAIKYKNYKELIDHIISGPNSLEMLLELFTTQTAIIDYLMAKIFCLDKLRLGKATCLLNLRSGYGKTYIAAGIIAKLNVRTLYVVPKRPHQRQAVKDLDKCLGPEIARAHIRSAKLTFDALVDVIVINSALLENEDYFSQFLLAIFDEIHMYCSPTRKEIFRKANCLMCLGMTATPNQRPDKFDDVAIRELAFDGILNASDISGFSYDDVQFASTALLIKYYGPDDHTLTLRHPATDKMFVHYMIKQLVDDEARIKIVLTCLRELYKLNRYIYVFSETIEPLISLLERISAELNISGVFAPELVGKFIGGIKDEQAQNMRDNAKILLTTYAYSGTGISIDKMDTIIFLTPRKSNMEQILGRILRRSGDQSIRRLVIDIIDYKTPLKSQLSSRKHAYNHYNMSMKNITIHHDSTADFAALEKLCSAPACTWN